VSKPFKLSVTVLLLEVTIVVGWTVFVCYYLSSEQR